MPKVIRKPRIALDVDCPEDLVLFLKEPSATRAYALLQQWGMTEGGVLDPVRKRSA
jgi:hypothetical protein